MRSSVEPERMDEMMKTGRRSSRSVASSPADGRRYVAAGRSAGSGGAGLFPFAAWGCSPHLEAGGGGEGPVQVARETHASAR
ncbi:hypothetical protein LV779_14375 [Streptomyces thinghirensis]|nr:hypothetical protein [Streptomyces thinghirensis]